GDGNSPQRHKGHRETIRRTAGPEFLIHWPACWRDPGMPQSLRALRASVVTLCRTQTCCPCADEISAQCAACPGGAVAGLVCQPGLDAGAVARLERWPVARRDGAGDAAARPAVVAAAGAGGRRRGLRPRFRLAANPP